MADYSHVGNGAYADKTLVKATEISQVVMTVQGAQEMLQQSAHGLPALTDSTYRKGQLRQAPSYLLGKPLHDFDATGNGKPAKPSKETFLVLSRRAKLSHDQAYRFNMSRSLLLLDPLHPLRLFAIRIITHQYPIAVNY
ncbi:hypothetical protein OS493_007492 [Desmophyllum pertusum]|uniref:Uncharacterized protein n=1 Tax=Desmophyllum pertusum TaxID=174260 RepID=A0A9W9Z3M0_9CNID|nr:hypothetical protein OS493_007492 [Desmophyllum pertusum]